MATDGATYIIKGPDSRLVFTEYIAYELAAAVGIPVPQHALCTVPGEGQVWFASKKLRYRISPEDTLDLDLVENREMLAHTAVFDIWIANDDRNVGNLVGDRGVDGRVRWYAIDFERAHALRGESDLFTIMGMNPRQMWPKERLGRYCAEQPIPHPICERIAQLSNASGPIVEEWNSDLGLPRMDWHDRMGTILAQRAERIHDLVQEAWR